MNSRSIRFRLILWYSVLAIGVSALFAVYTWHSFRDHLYAEAGQTLKRRAAQIDDFIIHGAAAADLKQVGERIDAVYSPEGNSRFIRVSRARAVIYQSGDPENKSFSSKTVPFTADASHHQNIVHLSDGSSLLIVTKPVTIAGENGLIEMGLSTAELDDPLSKLLVILVAGLAIAVVIMVAGGYFLIGNSLRPVETIRSTAEQITFGNLSSRLPVVATGDAIEALSVTLNQMLERLETAYQQAKRFSADASHELRTPLAIMKAELESMLGQPWPEQAVDQLVSVMEETDHLSRIVENLLSLSRLDAGDARFDQSRIDLAALVRSTAEQMILLVEEKHQALVIQAERPVVINADPTMMRQVIINLLDNAVKYTRLGGTIILAVVAGDGKAVLQVADNGVGISEASLPHVMNRFFRSERAKNSDISGAGLGLAVVKSICEAHNGAIDIESREGSGTTVKVILPLAENGETA